MHKTTWHSLYRPSCRSVLSERCCFENIHRVILKFGNNVHSSTKYVNYIQNENICHDKELTFVWKSIDKNINKEEYALFFQQIAHDLHMFIVKFSEFNKFDYERTNRQSIINGFGTTVCFNYRMPYWTNSNLTKKQHKDAIDVVKIFCHNSQHVIYILTCYRKSDCQIVFQIHSAFRDRLIRILNEIFRSLGYNFDGKARYVTDSFIYRLFSFKSTYTFVLPLLLLENTNVGLFPLLLPPGKTNVNRDLVIKDTCNIRQTSKPSSSHSPLIFTFSLICVLAYESLRRNDNINRTKEISEKLFSLLYKKSSISKIQKDRRILESLRELKTIKVCQDITAYPVSRLSLTHILDKESLGSLSEGRMNNELMRLSTLSNFPVHGISLIRLAENGFFFEGNGDELVCYSCGLRLKGWRADSNPADIHQKYSPNCQHILEKKSDPVELSESRNSIATYGRTEGSHADVSNADITCEKITCTDLRHEDSFNSLLIATSKNARFPSSMEGRVSNNCASTNFSQQSKRSISNMTNHVSSSNSVMGGQSGDHQFPSSNGSVNYFADGYRLSDSGHGRQHTLSCNPCSDFISSNMPRLSIGSMNGRTQTRTSFLDRQLSVDGEQNLTHNPLITKEQILLSTENSHYQDTELYLPSPPILQTLTDRFEQNISYTCSDEKLSADSIAHRATRPSPLKYPNYESLQSRKDSYFDWPEKRSSLHPYDLSECGLFFTHFEDCVRCFQCGIGLRNWEEDDNPWVEHARWSRKCQYLIRRKGQEFIDSIVQLLGLETVSCPCSLD
ncbi:uncharacterized protein [Mytilus edulis]|uniref:uncharacterized protein n=1 Tax=Mytilus edulis TaxID=6550 RepID=UPI0039F0C3BC